MDIENKPSLWEFWCCVWSICIIKMIVNMYQDGKYDTVYFTTFGLACRNTSIVCGNELYLGMVTLGKITKYMVICSFRCNYNTHDIMCWYLFRTPEIQTFELKLSVYMWTIIGCTYSWWLWSMESTMRNPNSHRIISVYSLSIALRSYYTLSRVSLWPLWQISRAYWHIAVLSYI